MRDTNYAVTLVRPYYHSHLITAPLGLGYVSSVLRRHGYSTRIVDGLSRRLSVAEIVRECRGSALVGINCMSAYFSEVVSLSRTLKDAGIIVVVGGPHASALPELTLKETSADFVAIGEGEHSVLQLARHLEEGLPTEHIPGIVSRHSLKWERRPLIGDLDSIPFPDWRQIDPRWYTQAPHGGLVKAFPVAPVISSRGCPFDCAFCASPFLWEQRIRFRSPANVVDEIEYLIKDFGVREVHFEDDNLTLKREHVEAVCSLILKRGLRLNWATPNGIRVDALDKELVRLMKRSGCYSVAFGIESGSQEILNAIHKKTDIGKIAAAVQLAHREGLITQGFFIFGLPGETEATIRQTIAFAKKLPLHKAQFLLLDVLPGSALWESYAKERVVSWDYKSYQEATWVPEGIERARLNKVPAEAFRSFFLRPRQLFFLMRYFKPSQIPFIVRRLVDFNVFSFNRN